jgi:uracil-DNA glycosylase family 4
MSLETIKSQLGNDHVYVKGFGNPSAKLMIVAPFPNKYEEATGLSLQGDAGKILNEMLKLGGMDRSMTYTTSFIKVRLPQTKGTLVNRLKSIGFDITLFSEHLRNEIQAIKPNCILAFDDPVLFNLTGKKKIKDWRGSILKGWGGYKVVPTYHPGNLSEYYNSGNEFDDSTSKYSSKVYMQLDFNRAITESHSKEIDLPIRALRICRSAGQLLDFLERYKAKRKVAVDIEVHRAIPICIGLAFDSNYGLSIPLLNVDSQRYKDPIPKSEQALIWSILAEFFQRLEIEVIGQNFHFDRTLMEYVCGIPIPGLKHELMYKAQTLHPELPKSLAFLQSIYTREPFHKNELKEYIPGKDKIEDVHTYNAKDCVVTYEVDTQLDKDIDELGLRPFYIKRMLPMHDLYYKIEQRGIAADTVVRDALWIKYSRYQEELLDELHSLAGFELNPASPKQVGIFLYEELKLPVRDGTDEDTLCGLIANHAKTDKQRRAMELIILIRSVKTIKDSFIAARLDFDGRFKFLYNPAAAETGRSSGSKWDPPIRPIKGIGFNFQNLPKHGKLAKDIRKMFIPDPGWEFLNFDLSQAEPRIVAHLAQDEILLEEFRTGVDVHRKMGGLCVGKPPADLSENERFIGKTTRNAMNYDGKKGTLMKTIMSLSKKFDLGINVSEKQCDGYLKVAHAACPAVKGVFHKGIQDTLEHNNRVLYTPYGRRRQFFDRWGIKLFGEAYANIPQGTVKDKIVEVLLEIESWGQNEIMILGEAHDAGLCQVKKGTKEKYAAKIKAIVEQPIDFKDCSLPRGLLTIPAGFEYGSNYADLVKFKV